MDKEIETEKSNSLEGVRSALPASSQFDLHLDAAIDLLRSSLVVNPKLDHVAILEEQERR